MKYLFLILTLAWANWTLAQDVREVRPFDQVTLSGKIDVILEQGDEEKVIIESNNVPEDKVNVNIRGGTLKVGLVEGWFNNNYDRVDIRIVYSNLSMVRAQAGAIVRATGTLTGERFEVKATSGAEVKFTIDVGTLEAGAAEGAVLELDGKAENQYATAATGGEYDASELEVQRTEVRANTGGEAIVVANESLDASANTGGKVRYIGNPSEKYTRSNLAGDIRQY